MARSLFRLLAVLTFAWVQSVRAATPIVLQVNNSSPYNIVAGNSLYMSVMATSGSSPITYQWKKNGTAITNAISPGFSINVVAASDAGSYTADATNAAGTVTSSPIVVNVSPAVAPVFVAQPTPASQAVAYGATFVVSVNVNGNPLPTYQWFRNGVAIATNGINSAYIGTFATAADTGNYTVTATNVGGSVTSQAAAVTVSAPVAPTITIQPISRTVPAGNSTGFAIGLTGSPNFTYQWYKDGVALQGVTSANFDISQVKASDAGSYTITVTNLAGSATSQPGVLTISAALPPNFGSGAANTRPSVNVGGSLTLTSPSIFSGVGPFTYQWYKDGAAISGATASTYVISNAQLSNAGYYVASVTNSGGTTSSPSFQVLVNPIASSGSTWIDSQQLGGVAYFLFSSHVERYDLVNQVWLASKNLSQTATAFCAASDGIYISFGNTVAKFPLDLSSQTTLANVGGPVIGMFSAGNYIYNISSQTVNTVYPLDRTTGVAGTSTAVGLSQTTLVPAVVAGTQVYLEAAYGGEVCYALGSGGALSFVSAFNNASSLPAGRILALPNGTQVADSSGLVFNAADNSVAASLGGTATDLTPLADGSIVALRGNILVRFTGAGFGEIGHLALPVTGTNVYGQGQNLTVFYPGTSSGNSFVGLTTVNVNTLSDYTAAAVVDPSTVNYQPDAVAQDESGIIYLYSRATENIYRWSPTSRSYLASIPLTGAPAIMAYSASQHRLYLEYSTGKITQLDVTAVNPVEQSLGAMPGSNPTALVPIGNFLIASGTGLDVLGLDGHVASYNSNSSLGGPAAWSDATSTLFTIQFNVLGTGTPDATGHFPTTASPSLRSGSGDSFAAPIVVNPDGSRLLLGSGQVFLINPFGDLLGTLANSVTDGAWLGQMPFTIHPGTSGTEVQSWSAASSLLTGTAELTGIPLRIFPFNGTQIVALTQTATAPAFTLLNPSLQVVSTTLPVAGGNSAPVIVSQPAASVSIFAGSAYDLAVGTTGSSPQSYQWSFNGSPLPGATSAVLHFASVSASNSGNYSVAITNTQGSVTSPTFTLGVYPAIQIVTQPQSQSVSPNTSVTLSVAVAGSDVPTYQWYDTGAPVAGATSSSLVLNHPSSSGTYWVQISNLAGTVVSNPAQLTVVQNAPLAIVTAPQSTSAPIGGTATFSVVATGSPITYQWYFNNLPIDGATSATLTISNVQLSNVGSYFVRVIQGGSSIGPATVNLTITGYPTFTTQPSNSTIAAGSSASFTVAFSNSSGAAIQWYFNGTAIPGATDATYTLANAQVANVGLYYAVVTNPNGSATSQSATLSVTTGIPGSAPTITSTNWTQTVSAGNSVTFAVNATSHGLTLSYQWYFNGAPIAGATGAVFTLPAAFPANAGGYSVIVSSIGGASSSTSMPLTVTALYPGAYFGSFAGSGIWALYVSANNSGTFIGVLPQNQGVIVVNGSVESSSGVFTASGTITPASQAGTGRSTADRPTPNASGASLSVNLGSSVTGSLGGSLNLSLTGLSDNAAGGNAAAGVYTASALNGASGNAYVIVGSSGQTLLIDVTPSAVDYATGIVNGAGQWSGTTNAGHALTLSIDAPTQALAATIGGASSTSFGGLAVGTSKTSRLLNLSTRAQVGSGDSALIAGFITNGGTSKHILLRGIGPALTGFGVSNALALPQVTLFDGQSNQLMQIGAWGGSPALAAEFIALNAFPLAATSTDSAVDVSLSPGSFTIHLAGLGGTTGNGLAEIYDADSGSPIGRLVNISSRAEVDSSVNAVTAGFVIGGVGPEKLLLRGVGPTLATFGVAGPLSAPVLTLYDSGGNALATNIGWVNDGEISTISTSVGAFPLPVGSVDCALLVTLNPGLYSVSITGNAGASGNALVEIYEVP